MSNFKIGLSGNVFEAAAQLAAAAYMAGERREGVFDDGTPVLVLMYALPGDTRHAVLSRYCTHYAAVRDMQADLQWAS